MADQPEEIHGVSMSQFSVARHFGGCTYNGASYVYDPSRDVLVRADVLKARAQRKREEKRAAREAERARQREIGA